MFIFIIIFIGFLLVSAISFSRSEPVVIVHEHRNSSPLWFLLLLGGGIWLYTSSDSSANPYSRQSLEQEETSLKEHHDSLDEVQINRATDAAHRTASSNIHVNVAPPSHGTASFTTYHHRDEPDMHSQHIILVKRFAHEEHATLLQQHFSLWKMHILKMDDPHYPYWNCVFIENEEEGHDKIREWNRHVSDFEHMGLELSLTEIETQQ